MSDGYIKGLITGILAAIGIVLLSVLIYFVFFHDLLKDNYVEPAFRDQESEDAYQNFLAQESMILNVIKTKFYEKVNDEDMYRGAYDGIMASLNDPYSRYYSKEEFETLNQTTEGEYVGIGCYVIQDQETQGILVVSVIEGTPCESAGLLEGDIIIAIDDRDITQDGLNQALSYIKGTPGTKVKIKVKRGEEFIELTMQREKIEQKTLSYKLLEGKVGYIAIDSFYKKTPEEFKTALKELEDQGMEKLIVDLRNNPGGLYDTAVEMLDIFLGKDMLAAYVEDNAGNQEKSYTKDDYAFDKPVVIMINGNSASASELFTQTMRDYGKATVIGTKSYGKGVYQNLYPVSSDGAAIKITGGRYFSPKGICVHGVGIEPDITVELEKNEEDGTAVSKEEDNQTKAALEYLKNK